MQAIFGKSRLARPKLAKRAKDGAQERSKGSLRASISLLAQRLRLSVFVKTSPLCTSKGTTIYSGCTSTATGTVGGRNFLKISSERPFFTREPRYHASEFQLYKGSPRRSGLFYISNSLSSGKKAETIVSVVFLNDIGVNLQKSPLLLLQPLYSW